MTLPQGVCGRKFRLPGGSSISMGLLILFYAIFIFNAYLYIFIFSAYTRRLVAENIDDTVTYIPGDIHLIPHSSQTRVAPFSARAPPLFHRWYLPGNFLNTSYDKSQEEASFRELVPDKDPLSDRIENQLMYRLPQPAIVNMSDSYLSDDISSNHSEQLKIIYLAEGFHAWDPMGHGREWFLENQCPVSTCTLTADRSMANVSDAVIIKSQYPHQRPNNRSDQVWILYMLESPLNTGGLNWARNVFNWTATYRMDSDIVAPYAKFVLYNSSVQSLEQPINYAAVKNVSGKVAWFVSRCWTPNKRLRYAEELSQYIPVDIYGACGENKCDVSNHTGCMEMLRHQYKFYLAFENSNCRWYITEKFWINALESWTIPIVMGAPLEDYRRLAPYKSFVHVDQFPDGPRALAEYLHELDKNDTLYNEYFRWRGTGQLINTFFFCRVCTMLHANIPRKSYENMEKWWREPGVCQKTVELEEDQQANGTFLGLENRTVPMHNASYAPR